MYLNGVTIEAAGHGGSGFNSRHDGSPLNCVWRIYGYYAITDRIVVIDLICFGLIVCIYIYVHIGV